MTFTLTPKQIAAQSVMAGDATHVMLFGGSRSGKTALIVRANVIRALKARKSRHDWGVKITTYAEGDEAGRNKSSYKPFFSK